MGRLRPDHRDVQAWPSGAAIDGLAAVTLPGLPAARGYPAGAPVSARHQDHRGRFEQPLDALDEARGVVAINDTVIEGGGEIHHLARHDAAILPDRADRQPV